MKLLEGRDARSVGIVTLSQTFSAASNFLIVLSLGRYGGIRMVGEYSLAFAIYTAFLGVQRASITSPLLARAIGSTAATSDESSFAVTSSLCLSVTTSVFLLGLGALLGNHSILLLGVVLPGVLLEDALRFVSFRVGRHMNAVLLDGIWVVGSAASVIVLRGHPASGTAVVLWGASGSAAALCGMAVMRLRPVSPFASARWWKAWLWRSGRWLTLESMFFNVDLQVQAFGFIALAGVDAFGRLQVAESLVGVSAFVITGVNVVALAYLARASEKRASAALLVSVIDFVAVGLVTAGILAGLPSILDILYRHRVVLSPHIVLAVGIYTGILSAACGPQALLMARHAEKAMPVTRALLTLFTPVAVVVSAASFQDALWVLCGAAAVYVVAIFYAAWRPPAAKDTVAPAHPAPLVDDRPVRATPATLV
jgi:O-antigen/teichoic acid export membrane protein